MVFMLMTKSKIYIHKTESDTKMDSILGEIIANGSIINGDKEEAKSEEKENTNELMETGDISDGLLQNLVDVLSDKSPDITVLSSVTNTSVCGDTLMSSSDGINDLIVDQPSVVPVPDVPGVINGPITLDQLEQEMVPVDSIQIEHIEADGTTTKINSMQLADVPGVICDDSNIAVVVMDEEADNQKPK